MTDKEKIRAEFIVRLEKARKALKICPASAIVGMVQAYENIVSYIDSLPEEKVSEDLLGIAMELEETIGTSPHSRLTVVEHLVKATNWQKEQIEKERLAHCDSLTKEQYEIESEFVVKHLEKNNRTPTFIDAIEHGKKMVIDKAVEWLYHQQLVLPDVDKFIDDFRKAMED